jgi:tRNA-2-methylthio-N6-dimethylallyladenosine synthase
VREVTLLGQIVDRYGYDWRGEMGNSGSVDAWHGASSRDAHQEYDLADLLREVHEIEGLWRIRFLTSHPNYMTRHILETVRDLPKLMEHIEVPIQAGDDQVLLNMRRGYTSGEYRELYRQIREILPNAAVHTDIIVGFCGESESQFQTTYDILAELKFDKVHLARYSPRPGTVSERRMADDVPEAEKVRRHQAIEALQEQVCAEINARFLGETVEVLVEDQHKGKWRGRNRQNKLVFIDSPLPLHGRLVEAEVIWTGPWSMQARFLRDVSPEGEQIVLPEVLGTPIALEW